MIYLILDVTLLRMLIAFRRRKEAINFYDEITTYLLHMWISAIFFNLFKLLAS
jgi:hypothetical protein